MIAFITGLIIGMFAGIFVMCLCRIAAEADRQVEDILRGL